MKYLRYILNDSLRPEQLISDRPYLREVTIIAVIPASFVALVILAWLIPGAGLMDMGRLIKLRVLQHQIRQRRRGYARCVLASLGHPITKIGVSMLLAA